MKKNNYQKYKDYLECNICGGKQKFTIEGNIKICQGCDTKSSYKYAPRKRWSYGKSFPDSVNFQASPFSPRECDEATQGKFDEVMGRIHKLSHREREIVQLLWEGKKESEVAKELGLSASAVNTYLNRARIKLK